jgi:hypothetical protein
MPINWERSSPKNCSSQLWSWGYEYPIKTNQRVITMAKSTSGNPSFEQVLRKMSPDVVATLTPEQVAEFQHAFRSMQASKHAIDLRLLIPFPNRGFYLVIFAGRERRSLERLRSENPRYLYSAAIGILSLFGLLAAVTVPSVLWLTTLTAKEEQIRPTAIPWLQDQKSCEATGRTWQDGNCWEKEWSHLY